MENQTQPSFTLTFTADELNLLFGSLSELPAKVSMQLILNLQNQIQTQVQGQPLPQ